MQNTIKDSIKKALRYSNAEYCEIRIEETTETCVRIRGNDIESASENVFLGGNVRALSRGGWGFVSFNRLDNLNGKVEEVSAQAKILGARIKKHVSLYPSDQVEDYVRGNFKKQAFAVPLKNKVRLLENYNRLILGSPKITSSSIYYMDKHTYLHFANSEGTYIYQEKMDLGGSLTAIASHNSLTVQESARFGSNQDFNVALGLEDEVIKAAEIAGQMLHAPVVEGGQYTVILDPDMAGLFVHEAFGHLSEADNLDEDERMKELLKIGTRYGSDQLDIYDSGIEGPNRGESKYDDEGVLMQKTYLIKGGIVSGHLHSRESAAKMGESATGNARALNYRFPPIVRMRTTCIAPGKYTFNEMLKGITKGVYVKGGYGGQTNGEMFTFAPSRAYMIRNSEIAEMVRDVNLTGNVFETLKNIDMIGSDFTFRNGPGGCGKAGQSPLPVAQGSPHIRIQKIVIGGKEK